MAAMTLHTLCVYCLGHHLTCPYDKAEASAAYTARQVALSREMSREILGGRYRDSGSVKMAQSGPTIPTTSNTIKRDSPGPGRPALTPAEKRLKERERKRAQRARRG